MYHTRRVQINDGWRFRYESAAAETVTLPHSWNGLDTMETGSGSHYRRGVGLYERGLALPEEAGRRYFLHVEAAAMKARLWLDDRPLGGHEGGYTGFDLPLPRATGRLRIAVDNRPDPDLIPSDMADFFLYGGLTRNVWWYDTGPLRTIDLRIVIDQFKKTTPTISLALTADGTHPHARAEVDVQAPDGDVVAHARRPLADLQQGVMLTPTAPLARWSVDRPVLYTVTVRLYAGEALSDEVVERVGWRTFSFPDGGPFFLNGERLLLRGTHRHEDWAGLGSAVPDALNRQELAQIKAAGFNFVRLGHYPQAAAVLDACDELGLLVWQELPWCRGGVGGDLFRRRARAMLREMIAEHGNRPSVIFWGLGNELDWDSEHPDTDDDDVLAFLVELNELAHVLDPTRLTALRRYERGADVVDVYSPSIWSGWYAGRYEEYEAALRRAMARYPRLIHAEWGGDSHQGRHNVGPHLRRAIGRHDSHAEQPGVALSREGEARASLDGDWSESYMLDLMEWHLQVQHSLPNLAGTAQWVFKDFGTPLRPENPIPYVNQKGLVTRDGQPKDVYQLFVARQTDRPVCAIESPTWPLRAGEPGSIQRVRVYSNCERVELWVNGHSQGAKFLQPTVTPAGGLVWLVPFRSGENRLEAVGWMADGRVVRTHLTQTLVCHSGPAVALRGTALPLDGNRVRITVQLVDDQGTPVLNSERRVTFALAGPGTMLANLGTPDGSRLVETANGRATLVIRDPGPGSVCTVTAPGLPATVVDCLPQESPHAA